MKKNKFRGKSIKSGDWLYGDLIVEKETVNAFIVNFGHLAKRFIRIIDAFEMVEQKTVGQSTGLVDANNVEIYEGDILLRQDDEYFIVEREDESAGFILTDYNRTYTLNFHNEDPAWYEVDGNIHEED